jgi:type IV secretion system protein TrbE
MLVFGSPERGGLVAKGFRLEPPDLRGASFEQLNAFQDRVRALLALVAPGRRLQIQWWPDSDYRQALLAYHCPDAGSVGPHDPRRAE